MESEELNRLRELIWELPETSEKASFGGAICFSIAGNKTLCYYHHNYLESGREVIWCQAYSELKQELILNKPRQYFQPTTSAGGHFSDWLGIYLDTEGEDAVDWEKVSRLLKDAYRKVAPKTLVKILETGG